MHRTRRSPFAVQLHSFFACLLLGAFAAATARADPAVLTLDSLSFVSFEDAETFSIPSGSTLTFDIGGVDSSGNLTFTISPESVVIPAVQVPGANVELQYSLAVPASGTISVASTGGGHIVHFAADVAVTLIRPDGTSGTYTYQLPFTTEITSATDILGEDTIERTGLRLIDGVWYTQIVGGTTNRDNAFPQPGAAVYAVLSGSFDQLPGLE